MYGVVFRVFFLVGKAPMESVHFPLEFIFLLNDSEMHETGDVHTVLDRLNEDNQKLETSEKMNNGLKMDSDLYPLP
jgi:hypothetical protein